MMKVRLLPQGIQLWVRLWAMMWAQAGPQETEVSGPGQHDTLSPPCALLDWANPEHLLAATSEHGGLHKEDGWLPTELPCLEWH